MNLHGGQDTAVKNHAESTQSCYSKLEEQFNAERHLFESRLAQIRTAVPIVDISSIRGDGLNLLDHLLNPSALGAEPCSQK
jgi:GTPase